MSENTDNQAVAQQEYKFPLYFLAKKPGYKSEEILEITDGPYSSEKEAVIQGRKKYGWRVSDYAVMKTEQSFQVAKIRIGN